MQPLSLRSDALRVTRTFRASEQFAMQPLSSVCLFSKQSVCLHLFVVQAVGLLSMQSSGGSAVRLSTSMGVTNLVCCKAFLCRA